MVPSHSDRTQGCWIDIDSGLTMIGFPKCHVIPICSLVAIGVSVLGSCGDPWEPSDDATLVMHGAYVGDPVDDRPWGPGEFEVLEGCVAVVNDGLVDSEGSPAVAIVPAESELVYQPEADVYGVKIDGEVYDMGVEYNGRGTPLEEKSELEEYEGTSECAEAMGADTGVYINDIEEE